MAKKPSRNSKIIPWHKELDFAWVTLAIIVFSSTIAYIMIKAVQG